MPNWPWRRRRAVRAAARQEDDEPTLEERVERLERDQKNRDLEMEEWHGKMRRVLARINRANQRAEENDEPEPRPRPDPRQVEMPMTVAEAKQRLGMLNGGR